MARHYRSFGGSPACALSVGAILLASWLIGATAAEPVFAATHTFLVSPSGVVLLLLLRSLAFYQRRFGGHTTDYAKGALNG